MNLAITLYSAGLNPRDPGRQTIHSRKTFGSDLIPGLTMIGSNHIALNLSICTSETKATWQPLPRGG